MHRVRRARDRGGVGDRAGTLAWTLQHHRRLHRDGDVSRAIPDLYGDRDAPSLEGRDPATAGHLTGPSI
jgi:hypothetical protein